MPISGEKYQFSKDNVDAAPNTPGVYVLLNDRGGVIYYGRSTTSVRSRLQSHYIGNEGVCTKGASSYKREACSNPKAREKQLLDAYVSANGKLPPCNARAA
jgi:hypothetical protein